MNEPLPTVISARPPRDGVEGREALEHPDRVVAAQHGDGRCRAGCARCGPAMPGEHHVGALTAKSSRWCSPTPKKSRPSRSASTPSATTSRIAAGVADESAVGAG